MGKGNTQKAAIFAGAGAATGFIAAKLLKVKKTKVTIILVIGLAAIGGIVGYKQS